MKTIICKGFLEILINFKKNDLKINLFFSLKNHNTMDFFKKQHRFPTAHEEIEYVVNIILNIQEKDQSKCVSISEDHSKPQKSCKTPNEKSLICSVEEVLEKSIEGNYPSKNNHPEVLEDKNDHFDDYSYISKENERNAEGEWSIYSKELNKTNFEQSDRKIDKEKLYLSSKEVSIIKEEDKNDENYDNKKEIYNFKEDNNDKNLKESKINENEQLKSTNKDEEHYNNNNDKEEECHNNEEINSEIIFLDNDIEKFEFHNESVVPETENREKLKNRQLGHGINNNELMFEESVFNFEDIELSLLKSKRNNHDMSGKAKEYYEHNESEASSEEFNLKADEETGFSSLFNRIIPYIYFFFDYITHI